MTMKSQFTEGICETPSPGGNHTGLSGGYPIADAGPGGQGLVSSPYDNGICPTPGGKETSSSELGTTPTLTDVKDGQSSGSASRIGMVDDHANAGGATFKTSK